MPISRRTMLAALPVGLSFPLLTARAAPDYDGARAVYDALRSQPAQIIPVDHGRIRLVFADGAAGLNRARVIGWVTNAARSLAAYYGRFPVADYGLIVIAGEGDQVGHATTWGFAGPVTRIEVGRGAGPAAFAEDWVLVHEMVHTALPDLSREHLWLQEGNATWVEPIARAQAGLLAPSEVWRWALRGLPRGMVTQDGGLDGTEQHDRLYWGGALFWLLAEIAIWEASGSKHSLRDALRAINRQSGGNATDWSADQVMAAGDMATGGDALAKLYRAMADRASSADLPDLFRRLGVSQRGSQIVFDERAPLAALRRSITPA